MIYLNIEGAFQKTLAKIFGVFIFKIPLLLSDKSNPSKTPNSMSSINWKQINQEMLCLYLKKTDFKKKQFW
jgi:hypothetical protein